MKYYGNVYRPPSEARSLIIQATIGCSHNKCRFCYMYQDEPFIIRKVDEIKADIDESMAYHPWKRVFLADGDALVMKTKDLIDIASYIYANYPFVQRVGAYATVQDLNRKSLEDLISIRESGLEILYIGIESGSDAVLEAMDKDVTAEETIQALKKAKEAGFTTSVTAISGLGGRENSSSHILETARVVSESRPDYVSFLSLIVDPAMPLYKDIQEKKFSELNPEEVLQEIKLFLENVDSPGTVFRSNHASNYVPLAGNFNEDIPRMIHQIDQALATKNFKPDFLRGF